MTTYLVELECEAREVYAVEADSPEEASERWDRGVRVVAEINAGTVISVREEDGEDT